MSGGWETVVGLEIHAELSTDSKLLCGCKNAFGAPPNTLCCPVCTGMPGALPVLNQRAVEYVVKMGLALGCAINTTAHMDRKHYFYPDLPKAYQITQQALPLCENGRLDIVLDGRRCHIGITRIHLEEDAGKLAHHPATGQTLVDFNRSGVPLMELVTAPDLRGADEAKAVMEALARLMVYLGISDAKMQEGSLRADVNVSLRRAGQQACGARVEMKNINSFMAVHRAITYEAARQEAILAAGGAVRQETRRWDDAKGEGTPLRAKEEAADYRYFPDPDLLPFEIPPARVEALRSELPELPLARAARYVKAFGLTPAEADILCAERARADFFEAAVDAAAAKKEAGAKQLANWMLGDLPRLLRERGTALEDTRLTPESLAGMVALIENGTISNTAGKQVLAALLEEDVHPAQLVERLGLAQQSDPAALAGLVAQVLADNPRAVADYNAGKANALGFLVGRCMRASGGRGNPAALQKLVRQALAGPAGPRDTESSR